MRVKVEVSLFVCVVFFINSLASLHTPWWLWSPEKKPAFFFNLLNKLYVLVDRVQMVMKLFYVDFLKAGIEFIHVPPVPPSWKMSVGQNCPCQGCNTIIVSLLSEDMSTALTWHTLPCDSPIKFQKSAKISEKESPELENLLHFSIYGLDVTPGQLIIKMVASISLKTTNSAKFYRGIPSSNGVLKSLPRALMLRKLDAQNRAQLFVSVIIIS